MFWNSCEIAIWKFDLHRMPNQIYVLFPNFQIFPQIIWCYPQTMRKGKELRFSYHTPVWKLLTEFM